MPQHPSWLDKVNFIELYIMNPCEAPWTLYVRTALPLIPGVARELIMFSYDDIARSLFRPNQPRKKRHGRKRNGKRSGPGIPEISDLLLRDRAKDVGITARRLSQGVHNLWIIDTALQRFLYWYMIVDLATDFTYDTLLGVMTDEHSTCSLGRGMGTRDDLIRGAGPDYGLVTIDHVKYAEGGVVVAPGFIGVPPGKFQITFAGKAGTYFPDDPPGQAALGLSWHLDGEDHTAQSGSVVTQFAGGAEMVVAAYINSSVGCTIQFTAQVLGSTARMHDLVMLALQLG